MPERVIIRQWSDFSIEFQATGEQDDNFKPVEHLHELTPFGMLLAGLGSCTTILLLSYAQNHELDLHMVEGFLEYQPDEERRTGWEKISMRLRFEGDLSPEDEKRLFVVAEQCPIERMLVDGTPVIVGPYQP